MVSTHHLPCVLYALNKQKGIILRKNNAIEWIKEISGKMSHKAVNEYRTILFSRLQERKQLTFKLLTLCKILEAHWLIGERYLTITRSLYPLMAFFKIIIL